MNSQRPKLLARSVELYPDGTILLIRCPKCEKENWAPQVASGICAWCGFDGRTLLKDVKS